MSFKYIVEGWLMPSVGVFGLAGNFLSMKILHHREVRLKKDYVDVLCMLATFDNLLLIATFFLFSLPTLSSAYLDSVFPYTVPYLYPLTNTFMTASGYMTAAVAVNRYLDICGGALPAAANKRMNGYLQASLVLFVSACINIPRWLEFKYTYMDVSRNETDLETGANITVNETKVMAYATKLRQRNDYIRDYTLISATVLIVLVPVLIMLVSSYLIYRKMMENESALTSLSSAQERARKKRNRNITFVLVGIIVLFLVCHLGEVGISIYELMDVLEGTRTPFPEWASNTVIVNHLLIVINSSLNFVIYCKDVVFRRVFLLSYHAIRCGNSSARSTAHELKNIKKELGDEVVPGPEVVIHDNLDAQSQILCGISKV